MNISEREYPLGLVPRRYQSGEVDYIGSISKCGDRRVRTLLYEAANVMLTRYKGQLKLKDWAFAIAKRSTMRKARFALARRLAIIMHAMLRDGTGLGSNCATRSRPAASTQAEWLDGICSTQGGTREAKAAAPKTC